MSVSCVRGYSGRARDLEQGHEGPSAMVSWMAGCPIDSRVPCATMAPQTSWSALEAFLVPVLHRPPGRLPPLPGGTVMVRDVPPGSVFFFSNILSDEDHFSEDHLFVSSSSAITGFLSTDCKVYIYIYIYIHTQGTHSWNILDLVYR